MFKKAERKRAPVKLCIMGASGSGKTYSALLLAKGLIQPNETIAVIDTEGGSGSLYAGMMNYDISEISAPFTPKRYVQEIIEAEKAGYGVLIIDSLSHAWVGQGGILEMHDKATQASKSQNSFNAWRDVTPEHNKLLEAISHATLHVICTLRTKTAYEVTDDAGKKKPVKIGLAPVQRDGLEYEFTIVFDLSVNGHIASVSKDRTGLFDGQNFVITEDNGRAIYEWLQSGVKEVSIKDVIESVKLAISTEGLHALWLSNKDRFEKKERDAFIVAINQRQSYLLGNND
jgi:hypothetical protein